MPRKVFISLLCALLTGPVTHAQVVNDPNLTVETYLSGLDTPTGAAFLNRSGGALVIQKNDGKVLSVRNKQVVGTALDLPVANDSEEGLLGIALSPKFSTDHRVFLYHTVAASDGGAAIANRISRYIWNGSVLTFEKDLIDLPASPGPNHNGGKITFDPQGNLLAVVGDLNHRERTQNFENTTQLLRTGSIIRIQSNGRRVNDNPFTDPNSTKRKVADDIFAYGIRNSFGLTIDPVTGKVWDTENGPQTFDEINQVAPGFNSGWMDIMGPISRNGGKTGTLVSLGPKAAYSDPEFSWAKTIAPTDLHFYNASGLGSAYRNDLFVGDVNTGSIYHFNLNAKRNGLVLSDGLSDRVADNAGGDLLAEQSSIVFGSGFGIVSDLLNGPDGLFALSLTNGTLYRITAPSAAPVPASFHLAPEPASGILWMISAGCIMTGRNRRRTIASRKSPGDRLSLQTRVHRPPSRW